MTPSEDIIPTCFYCGELCPVGYGRCHCGCGGLAPLADCSRGEGRPPKGQPNKFIQHHGPGIASHISFGEIDGESVTFIEITATHKAIIDRGREKEVSGHWHVHNGYACRWKTLDHKKVLIYMHKILMGVGTEVCGDHKFGNRMDNRMSRLRPTTSHQNAMNRAVSKRNKSGVTGVRWVESRKKWIATICYKGKLHYVGYSTDFEEVVRFREEAELRFFGEYSRRKL